MRIASFNVENMFLRAKALNQDTWAQGSPALERYAKINALLNQVTYSPADKIDVQPAEVWLVGGGSCRRESAARGLRQKAR